MKRSYYLLCHTLLWFPLCTILFLLPTLVGPTKAQATTYYVSLSGNDSNSGTSASSPFRTLSRAVKPLRPGDTLYIRGGLWTERIDLMNNNTTGTSGNYIKTAGYPGEKVTLQHADSIENDYGPIKARGTRGYLTFENLILDGSHSTNKTNWELVSGNHHFILRNLEIKNFKDNGLLIYGANDVQIINCSIHDQISLSGQPGQRWYGIYFHHGSNGLLQGNKVYNNPGGGMHLYPGPISNLVVRSNAVYNNNKLASSSVGGIIVQGSSSSIIYNTQIYNNLVYKNGTSSSGLASGILVSYYTNGTKVLNNTLYGNKTYGLQIGYDTSTKNTIAKNNISYGNTTGNYVNKGSGTTYTNNLTTNPGFVNSSVSNFMLRGDSPAIDKGAYLNNILLDYRNVARPRGSTHDIGGYEY